MSYFKNIIKIFTLLFILYAGIVYSQERTIKRGDAIEIMVSENEELTQTVLISPEGTVDYPAL